MSKLAFTQIGDRVDFYTNDGTMYFVSRLDDMQARQVVSAIQAAYAEGQRAKAIEVRSALAIPHNFWSDQQ